MNNTENGTKKTFDAKTLIDTFSSTLELFVYNGGLYLYDDYHEYDEEFDYGISYMMSLKEAEKDGISIGDIPDIFVENEIDFLLDDDLSNTYEVDEKTISKLSSSNCEKWADILRKNGYDDVADTLDTTLRMLSGEHSLPVDESDYYIQQDEKMISKIEETYNEEEETMDKRIIAYNIDWDVDMDEIYELLDNSTVEKAAELLEISPERYAAMTTEERHDYAYDKVHHNRLAAAEMVGLPDEVEIPEDILEYYEITSVDDDMSDITDWLSDKYGYCIYGYEVKEKEPVKYCVWDRQSEEIVEEFDTIEEADKYIEEIEEEAKEDGYFAPERYVIEEKTAIEQTEPTKKKADIERE